MESTALFYLLFSSMRNNSDSLLAVEWHVSSKTSWTMSRISSGCTLVVNNAHVTVKTKTIQQTSRTVTSRQQRAACPPFTALCAVSVGWDPSCHFGWQTERIPGKRPLSVRSLMTIKILNGDGKISLCLLKIKSSLCHCYFLTLNKQPTK